MRMLVLVERPLLVLWGLRHVSLTSTLYADDIYRNRLKWQKIRLKRIEKGSDPLVCLYQSLIKSWLADDVKQIRNT